jgi:prepilin-type N-terminal cleavage/methylation domain-containing protein
MRQHKHPHEGFTLVELLTVIAIIGVLAAILIPVVGKVRENAQRASDLANIRSIGQAALVYAQEHSGNLPATNIPAAAGSTGFVPVGTSATTTLYSYAAALALSGGLNNGAVWVSPSDLTGTQGLGNILDNAQPRTFAAGTPAFDGAILSFQAFSGLRTSMGANTPVVWTRGLTAANGVWDNSRENSVYGGDGGHVFFMGGHVQFFDNLGSDDTNGRLITSNGTRTRQLLAAAPAFSGTNAWQTPRVLSSTGAGTGAGLTQDTLATGSL